MGHVSAGSRGLRKRCPIRVQIPAVYVGSTSCTSTPTDLENETFPFIDCRSFSFFSRSHRRTVRLFFFAPLQPIWIINRPSSIYLPPSDSLLLVASLLFPSRFYRSPFSRLSVFFRFSCSITGIYDELPLIRPSDSLTVLIETGPRNYERRGRATVGGGLPGNVYISSFLTCRSIASLRLHPRKRYSVFEEVPSCSRLWSIPFHHRLYYRFDVDPLAIATLPSNLSFAAGSMSF